MSFNAILIKPTLKMKNIHFRKFFRFLLILLILTCTISALIKFYPGFARTYRLPRTEQRKMIALNGLIFALTPSKCSRIELSVPPVWKKISWIYLRGWKSNFFFSLSKIRDLRAIQRSTTCFTMAITSRKLNSICRFFSLETLNAFFSKLLFPNWFPRFLRN